MHNDPWQQLKVGEEIYMPLLEGETFERAKARLKTRALKLANKDGGYFLVKAENDQLIVRRMNDWPLDKLSEWTSLIVGQAIRLSRQPNKRMLEGARERKYYLEARGFGPFMLEERYGDLWLVRER